MPEERLQKILAAAGVASRRGAEVLIEAGRVRVDGRVAKLGDRADPETARIEVDGAPIAARPTLVHLALHKPAGVTSTVRDPHADRTVVDLLPPAREAARIYPVGRLDRDSEGLLLLTNDGPWSEAVLHPRHGVEREYAVGVGSRCSAATTAAALRTGIELEEGIARVLPTPAPDRRRDATPDRAHRRRGRHGSHWYRITHRPGMEAADPADARRGRDSRGPARAGPDGPRPARRPPQRGDPRTERARGPGARPVRLAAVDARRAPYPRPR